MHPINKLTVSEETNLSGISQRDKEIENFKTKIRILKQFQTTSIIGDNPKNPQIASRSETTQTTNVLTFIQQTMKTLTAYN